MTKLIHANSRFTAAGMLLLCWGAAAVADEFDLRNLDLDSYTYPASETVDKRQDQNYATLKLLSRDSSADVVKYYESMGLKVNSAEDNNASGHVVPPGRIMFDNRMLSAHVPLTVIVDTDSSQGHDLDDHDLYDDLKIYVATGVKMQSDVDSVRQRFDGLKHRFYKSSPNSSLTECKSSISEAQELSMEERGRRMQELAMQGRRDELKKMMEGLMNDSDLSSPDGMAADKWDEEIKCLEKLENEAYPVQISVVANRDDLLG